MLVTSLDGSSKPRPLVNTPAFEGGAQFSPDGKWVAFSSNESAIPGFVKALKGSDRKWPVSQWEIPEMESQRPRAVLSRWEQDDELTV